MKLRSRPQPPAWSRGRILSSRARGDTADSHGTLQRLLDDLAVDILSVSYLEDSDFAPRVIY